MNDLKNNIGGFFKNISESTLGLLQKGLNIEFRNYPLYSIRIIISVIKQNLGNIRGYAVYYL